MKIEAPARPYGKNISDAAANVVWMTPEKFKAKFDLIKKWPCLKCQGTGQTREWTGVGSDYNEDMCGVCRSTGVIDKKDFKTWYDNVMDLYTTRLKNYRELREKVRSIRKKLTKAEFQFISQYQL